MKLKELIITASSSDDAIALASHKLGISEDYLMVEESIDHKYRVFVNVSLNLLGKRYLVNYFENLGLEAQMEIRTDDKNNTLIFNVTTNNNAIVIGKDGKNLTALQTLLRILLEQFIADDTRIIVDACGYAEYRNKKIESLAVKTAKQVLTTKKDIKLLPMNPYERRLIHTRLADFNKRIATESEGSKENRAVIIRYVKD